MAVGQRTKNMTRIHKQDIRWTCLLLAVMCLKNNVDGAVQTTIATPSPPTSKVTTIVTPSPPTSATHVFTATATTTASYTPSRIPSPATLPPGATTTEATDVCENRIDTCSHYGRTPCTDKVYEAWARYHCALYCGFCHPNVTNLNPGDCENKVPNCAEYDGGNLCTAESYYTWAYENCRGYCKFDKCNDTVCADQPGFDCKAVDDALGLCEDKQKAKLVCRKYCNLCKLVDGKWSPWASWGDCSASCANGTRIRTRTCTNPPPSNGGLNCQGSNSQNQPCERPPCPEAGLWSSWSPWGFCSVSCDVGMQRRDRSCSDPYPKLQGDHCFGTPIEYKICMHGACADGQWSEWEEWSNCSSKCGGVRMRERNCSNPEPSALGKQCMGNSVDTEPCNCTVPYFTAKNLVSGPSSGTVRFSSILFSQGDGYNSSTGEFTCTIPGFYHFTASLTKSGTGSVYRAYCYIRLNGLNKIHIDINPKDTSNSGYGYYSASGSVVLRLDEGDKVNLGSCSSASYFDSSTSLFTGFMVKAD